MKKNIFFIVTSDLFIRNYIWTNVLEEIEKHNNIYYLACDKNVTLKNEIKKKKIFYVFTISLIIKEKDIKIFIFHYSSKKNINQKL